MTIGGRFFGAAAIDKVGRGVAVLHAGRAHVRLVNGVAGLRHCGDTRGLARVCKAIERI